MKAKSASIEKKKGSESGKASSGTETEKLDPVQVKVKAITSIGKKESRKSPVVLSPQSSLLTEKDKGSSTSKKNLNAKFGAEGSSGANGKKVTSSPVETRSANRRKVASTAESGKKQAPTATGRKKQAPTAESKKKLLTAAEASKRKPPTSTKKQTLTTVAAADRSLGSATAKNLMGVRTRSKRFINSITIDTEREHCTSETIIGMIFCSNALTCTTQEGHQSSASNNDNNNNSNNNNVVIIAKKEESDSKSKVKLASTESDSYELSDTKTINICTKSSSGHHGVYSMHLNADEAIKTIIKLLQENYIMGDINAAQMEAIKDKAISKVNWST